jgi:hypothetical protein
VLAACDFQERLPAALVPLRYPSALGVIARIPELALGLLQPVAQLGLI